MKLSTTKLGLRSLLAGFFLFGALMFVSASAQAQTTSDNLNWKTVPEAQTVLATALDVEGQNLTNLTPGTPAYQQAEQHAALYKMILMSLGSGNSVPEAVNEGVGAVDIPETDANPQAKVTRTQLLNHVVPMLTN